MHLSALTLSTEVLEPTTTIKKYLKINLDKEHPCIHVQDQKLESLSLQKYYETEKPVDQLVLFSKVIEKLTPSKKVTPLDLRGIGSQSMSPSSSNDSLPLNKKNNANDIFLEHLNVIAPEKQADSIISIVAKIIVNIANDLIISLSKNNPILKKFHTNNLINGLDCHKDQLKLLLENYKIPMSKSPRIIHKISNEYNKHSLFNSNAVKELIDASVKESVEASTVKKLSDDAIYKLIAYWTDSYEDFLHDSPRPENLPEKLKGFINELDGENEKLILHHQLYKFTASAKIHEEAVMRALKEVKDFKLGPDINRHLSHITIVSKKNHTTLFSYEKNLKFEKKESASLFERKDSKNQKTNKLKFDYGLIQCKKLFQTFLIFLSSDQKFNKLVLDKFISIGSTQPHNEEDLACVCIEFIEYLKTGKFETKEADLSTKFLKVLYTLTQQPYLLPATFIKQLLQNLLINFEKGDNSRTIHYEFDENTITLTSSINGTTTIHGGVNILISNTSKSTLDTLGKWTSEISVKLIPNSNKHTDEIKQKIVIPLQKLGFNVVVETSAFIKSSKGS